MKTYPKMKDSGIKWIGDIPKNWHVDKIKYHYNIVTGKVLQSNKKNSDEVLVDYITAGNIMWEKVVLDNLSQMWVSKVELKHLEVKNNDLLICEGGEAGRSAILTDLKTNCIIQNHVHRLRQRDNSIPKLLMYMMEFFNNAGILKSIIGRVTISSLPRLTLANLPMIYPENEQKQITKFLEKQTTKIDSEIKKYENLVKLLETKKQTIINQSVTKGLDLTVPMKDSGIKWIGDIPEHWKLDKFKHLAKRIIVGIAEGATYAYKQNGIPMIRSTNVKPNLIDKKNLLFIDDALSKKNKSKILCAGDIVTVRTGFPGISAVVPEDLEGSQCFTLLISSPTKNNSPKYLSYFLNSITGKIMFKLEGWGTAQINISVPILQNMLVTHPLLTEQNKIVKFLDNETSKINSLISKSKEQIKKLEEFRQSLISSAVTGKIDVRDSVA